MLGISYNVIDKYVSYHYGYARTEDGEINFSNKNSFINCLLFYLY